MARTVNQDEFLNKRKEILDAAHRLVFTKGFDQMSVRDIQDQLNISSGAFHHYFGSREALLNAYIERIKAESAKPLLPLIQDLNLSALEKLQGFLNTLDSLRGAQRAQVLALLKVWYTDSNALVRQKVDAAVFEQRVPMIAQVIEQGVQEGVFQVSEPSKSAQVVLTLLQGMATIHAALLLSVAHEAGEPGENRAAALIPEIVATHAVYMDAVERVLGAPARSLARTDASAVAPWAAAIREQEKEKPQ